MKKNKIAVVGTVGLPANYGGFETLTDNLIRYHEALFMPELVTVYCSGTSYSQKKTYYRSARLKYIPLNANGLQSVFYDIWSLFSTVWNRNDVVLLLGVSGAVALPLLRFLSNTRVVTNIDGVEWRREKWKGVAKYFLRFSEKVAVAYSHELIADNEVIAQYVMQEYKRCCKVIAYGGDHAVVATAAMVDEYKLPINYAFSVCRIEPENNVSMIVEAFSACSHIPLVLVGNWNNSDYGRRLRERYTNVAHLYLLDPIFDLGKLKTLRSEAMLYIHGHSAGGTNPSLVEAMHFGRPILAFDCEFNRATTENKAHFFRDVEELYSLIAGFEKIDFVENGSVMLEIAQRRYTWDVVARKYFELLRDALKNYPKFGKMTRGSFK